MITKTENNLRKAARYFTSLGLKLNIQKTQFVPLTNAPNLRDEMLQVVLNENSGTDDIVPAKENATHLGLLVDHTLNFKDHKTRTLKKLKSVHALVRSVRNKLPKSATIDLYNTLFLSSHDYAAAAFGTVGYGCADISNELEIIHRKMLRCVHKQLPWDISNSDLYSITEQETLEMRRHIITGKLIHNCAYKNAPINLSQAVQISQTTDRAREELRLEVPSAMRNNLIKNSFVYRGASLWNTLPREIRQTENLGQFTNKLRNHLKILNQTQHI
jgi:hypothetical protein